MKIKLIYLTLISLLLIIAGCGDDGNEIKEVVPKDVMKTLEISNKTKIFEKRVFSYTDKGVRTGEILTLYTDEGSTVKESIYNNFGNLVALTVTEKNFDDTIKSVTNYSFIYDYAAAVLTIKKDNKLKYVLNFWSGEDIKIIKEEKYQLLMTYLENLYSGYALEFNYLNSPQEFNCNIKNMVRVALIYDDFEKKDYKIEYSEKGKILRETRKDKRYEYKYESKTKISKKEYDNFDGVTGENIYILDTDAKGNVKALLLNENYVWQKLIYYGDVNNIIKEEFTSNIPYLKSKIGNYIKIYNYTLGKITTVTVDYSGNLTAPEKGIYTLTPENIILQYDNKIIIRKYTYNSNGTIYKYDIFSSNTDITSDISMIDSSDL